MNKQQQSIRDVMLMVIRTIEAATSIHYSKHTTAPEFVIYLGRAQIAAIKYSIMHPANKVNSKLAAKDLQDLKEGTGTLDGHQAIPVNMESYCAVHYMDGVLGYD